MIISSISEESNEDENEKEISEKIQISNKNNRKFLSTKILKIKEEIKDFVINRYIKIIYKQNKEIEMIKKKYEDLLKSSSHILKIIIDKKILNNENSKHSIEKNNSSKNKFIKVSKNTINANTLNKNINRTNKKIKINKEELSYINKKKKSIYKKNKYKNKNTNKSFFSNSNRIFKRRINLDDKENINNNCNFNYNFNNKSQINIDYLKELNKKDLKKIKFIKQKLLNTTINNNILNNIEINFNPKKNKINNHNRNAKLQNINKNNKNIKNNSFCCGNRNNYNTPKNIEGIKKHNKISKNNSSYYFNNNNINKIKSQKYIIKNNPIRSFYINEFMKSDKEEEDIEFNSYHGRYFSYNNSFLKNSNQNLLLASFINYKKDTDDDKNQIYNPKFNTYLNRYNH